MMLMQRSRFTVFSLTALAGLWFALCAWPATAVERSRGQRPPRAAASEETEMTVSATEEDGASDGASMADDVANEAHNAAASEPKVGAIESKRAGRKNQAATQTVKDPALEVTDPRTYRLKVIIRVESPDGRATNVVAVGPIPMEWPEQKVRLISEKISPDAKVSQSVLKNQAAMLKLQVAAIAKGEAAYVERLYEITRYRMQFMLPPEELKLPKQPPRELRDQLSGEAPGLEAKHPKIVSLAEGLRKTHQDAGPWEMIKSFWSWTRDNVEFQNGDFRGALFAVENHCGDCEEMSALFVSMCRVANIGARTVWVEGHDYPEFYLLDKKGQGHWIPAQLVGPPWFGEMAEYRPIFQKGDRFYDPFQKQYSRYVPHTVRADGNAAPKLIVKHDILAESDINGPSYNSSK